MITELITYFTTHFTSKITKEARAFGHLYESIALIHREKRCSKYWLSHRTMCKQFIEEHAANAKEKNSVLVLGSGPLHEIPLNFLAREFKQVDLVDVVQLNEIKKAWKHLSNVRFIETDVTELEKDLLKEKRPLEKVPDAFLNNHYDLVISANLLSQLSYHLRNFLEKKARPSLTEAELDVFANKVTYNHYLYLKKFSCPVILITDIETHLLDKNGEIVQKESPYINFSFPNPLDEWWWNVAPIPEFKKDLAIKMKVAGFLLNV